MQSPVGIGLGAAATGTSYGSGGGSPFDRDCPAGFALVGWSGRSASRVDALAPICAPLSLSVDTGASPDYAYRVTIGATTALSSVGGGGGSAFGADLCPAGEIVVGLRGRSGSELDRVFLQCGRVTLVRSGDAWSVSITTTGTTTERGGTGGSAFAYDCPSGRVVTGITGRSGTRIDAVAARCSSVTFSTR